MDHVVFEGNTTQLTPVLTVGGSGTYAFSSSAPSPAGIPGACFNVLVGVVAVTCVLTAPAPGASANTYANIFCGTGTTGGGPLAQTDTATVTTGGVGLTFHYGITFISGMGAIAGTMNGTPVSGWVMITPTGGSCASAVTNFTGTGQLDF